MPRDLTIAARLRSFGIETVETVGWAARGRDDFNPQGSINHHTAGAPFEPGKPTPSLKLCIFGRPDLSGPLCNVLVGYDNKAYVVASGVANHAGEPDNDGWRGLRFNRDVYGVEVEHPGKSLVTTARAKFIAKVHAALIWRAEGDDLPFANVGQHSEWAPSRKIDFATNFVTKAQKDNFRAMVQAHLKAHEPVIAWTVSYLNSQGKRVEERTKKKARWMADHPVAFQRGLVSFKPIRP